jgi:hypothetical protein
MPLDRGIIDQQLQALGEGTRWWDRRELRDLPAVLHADERILAISHGKVARVRWLRRSWLIVVTQQRLLCLRSHAQNGWKQLEVPAGQVTRASLRIGPFHGRVMLLAAGRTYRLLVPRADAYRLQTTLANLAVPGQAAMPGFAPTRIMHRVIDHVLALPAAALSPVELRPTPQHVQPAPDRLALDERLQRLETEVQELREQVDFLEQLLRERQRSGSREELPIG